MGQKSVLRETMQVFQRYRLQFSSLKVDYDWCQQSFTSKRKNGVPQISEPLDRLNWHPAFPRGSWYYERLARSSAHGPRWGLCPRALGRGSALQFPSILFYFCSLIFLYISLHFNSIVMKLLHYVPENVLPPLFAFHQFSIIRPHRNLCHSPFISILSFPSRFFPSSFLCFWITPLSPNLSAPLSICYTKACSNAYFLLLG